MRWIAIGLLGMWCAGCSFLTPGIDTRMAAEQRKTTTYDAEKNLAIEESTTQNNRTVMVEAEKGTATVKYGPDGSPLEITGASTILTQCSEPKDVMQGYMRLAEKNAEVAARMFGAIENLTGMIVPLMAARAQQQAASDDPTRLQQALDALRQLTSRPGP